MPDDLASSARTGHTIGASRRRRYWHALVGGGTEGNERLTTVTGLLLIVLLAVLGITIIRIGQLLWLHLFLGLVLIGPVALKVASTGYRFLRYYTSDAAYVRKGPPPTPLRLLAPLVVLFTVGVFASGVALLLIGSNGRGTLVLVHKVFFIAWAVVTAVHVLGHLSEIGRLLARARRSGVKSTAWRTARADDPVAGSSGRVAAVVLGLTCGLLVAVALLGQFAAWTHSPGGH
jgi:hypothetical protein